MQGPWGCRYIWGSLIIKTMGKPRFSKSSPERWYRPTPFLCVIPLINTSLAWTHPIMATSSYLLWVSGFDRELILCDSYGPVRWSFSLCQPISLKNQQLGQGLSLHYLCAGLLLTLYVPLNPLWHLSFLHLSSHGKCTHFYISGYITWPKDLT